MMTDQGAGAPGHDPSTRERVVRSVLVNGPSTAAALAARLQLTPAAVRRHLDQMLEAANARRRKRGAEELTEETLHAQVQEHQRDNIKRRDDYMADIEVAQMLDRVNERYAQVEKIKKFTILDHDLSQETGELTPTLKVKRNVINEKYADLFDALYED